MIAVLISASLHAPIPAVACDVIARNRHAPRPRERLAAFAELCVVVHVVHERRVTFHAMPDGGEIEAAFDRVGYVCLAHGLVRTRRYINVQRGLVNRQLDGVADRRHRLRYATTASISAGVKTL